MQRVVTLLVVSVATATGAAASPEACREAVFLAAARYDQTTTKVISSCQQHHVPDCDGDARAAAKVARATGKLQSSITLRCCGPDRICGTADDEALGAIGWGAGFCPNLDRGDCNPLISSPDDIAPCLACIGRTAAKDRVALTSVSASSGSDALARCANVIAKESSGLVARTSKALVACWKAREAGRHANPCPAPGDGKAAGAIAAAVVRARASICKSCGGSDRACGGADDLAPAVLGYPDACPAVTDPDGSACGGPISALSDLVDCVTCVAGHLAECTDHAAVPAFLAYPAECAAPPGTCAAGVECASGADCPAGYSCLDNGSGTTRYCVGPSCSDDGGCSGGAVCQQYCTFDGCGPQRCVCPGFGCGEAEVCIDDGGLACRELCTEDADCPGPLGVCVNSTFGSGLCINSTPCH
jgi:hypothetical protein